MSNQKRKPIFQFNMPKLVFGTEETVPDPQNAQNNHGKGKRKKNRRNPADVHPRSTRGRKSSRTDAMVQGVNHGLVHGNALIRAYPMFKRNGRIMLHDAYIEHAGSLSQALFEAAKYVMAQAWTVDVYIETSDQYVRMMSAWVEDEEDGNGNAARRRMIAVTSPVFEPYARGLENQCARIAINNIPTIPVPPHMRGNNAP